jgi:hypothetical protein
VAADPDSHTGAFLRPLLAGQSRRPATRKRSTKAKRRTA